MALGPPLLVLGTASLAWASGGSTLAGQVARLESTLASLLRDVQQFGREVDLAAGVAQAAPAGSVEGKRIARKGPRGLGINNGEYGEFVQFANQDGVIVHWAGADSASMGHAIYGNGDGIIVGYLGAASSRNGLLKLSRADGTLHSEASSGYTMHFNGTGNQTVFMGRKSLEETHLALYDDEGTAQIRAIASSGLGQIRTEGADIAEVFELADPTAVEPGMVVCLDADRPGTVGLCAHPGDPLVAGIVSGHEGFDIGMALGAREDGSRDLPVALTGRVVALADASRGPIRPGDPLIASGDAGRVCRGDAAADIGGIVGKALSGLESGTGTVTVLVALR